MDYSRVILLLISLLVAITGCVYYPTHEPFRKCRGFIRWVHRGRDL